MVLPAPATKHLGILHHPLPTRDAVLALRQIAPDRQDGGSGGSDGNSGWGGKGTTGTTLWLGGQVLAAYLSGLKRSASTGSAAGTAREGDVSTADGVPTPIPASTSAPPSPFPPSAPLSTPPAAPARPTVLELGAGIGFLSLSLAASGYDVVSTDIEPVLSSVLAPNVSAGSRVLPAGSGTVAVRELDWVAATDLSAPLPVNLGLGPDGALDMIVTADTVYAAHLVPYLWATIARLCRAAPSCARAPTLFIAIERRDPRMVDDALAQGRAAGMELRRVGHARVAKAVERAYGWKKDMEGWEGVEVWKGRWRG